MWTWWRMWRNVRTGRVRARSDCTAADLPPQKPGDKPAPHPCTSPRIHPSTARLIKHTSASILYHALPHGPVHNVKSQTNLRLSLCATVSFFCMCHCVKATNIFWAHTNALLTVNISSRCLVQETFLPKNWVILEEPMRSPRPSLTWHEATILCCLSNIQGKKINATWQHYIKSFCALIFLFCLCTFVWGVQRLVLKAQGEQSWREQCGNPGRKTTHVVFSLVSAATLKEAASLQTISYSYIIHHRRQVRLHPLCKIPNLTPRHCRDEDIQNKQYVYVKSNKIQTECAELKSNQFIMTLFLAAFEYWTFIFVISVSLHSLQSWQMYFAASLWAFF